MHDLGAYDLGANDLGACDAGIRDGWTPKNEVRVAPFVSLAASRSKLEFQPEHCDYCGGRDRGPCFGSTGRRIPHDSLDRRQQRFLAAIIRG
jgi:hypothetical protein